MGLQVKPAVSSHHSPLKVPLLRDIVPSDDQDLEPQESNFTPDVGHLDREFSPPRSLVWNPFGEKYVLFSAPFPLPRSFLICCIFEGASGQWQMLLCALIRRCRLFLSEPGSLMFFRVRYAVM